MHHKKRFFFEKYYELRDCGIVVVVWLVCNVVGRIKEVTQRQARLVLE